MKLITFIKKNIQQIQIQMGIEVEAQVFRWLQGLGIVKEGRRTNDNKIQLPEEATMKFYDGLYIGYILKQHVQAKGDESGVQKLEAIKENSTPAIRLYNWNILAEVLKKMGYQINYAQKSQILNLQPEPLIKVLDFLQGSKEIEAEAQGHKPLQVDITQVSKKTLRDAGNILEFFVISISKNFKLSPQHTLNLFLDNNKYLSHLLVKGIKGSYDPIFAVLSDISTNIDFIVVTLFCTDEKESLTFFLNAIKPALISKEATVSENCLTLFKELYTTYKSNGMGLGIAQKWMKQEGVHTLFFAIRRHQELVQQLIQLGYQFLEEEFFSFIEPTDKSPLWENDLQKLWFFNSFLKALTLESLMKFTQSKAYSNWIKVFIKMMKKSKEINDILSLMNIMEWLWTNMEKEFQTNENGLPNAYFAFLKMTSLHSNELICMESIRTMFSLMEQLGIRKNTYAPFFYKILINCLSFLTDLNRIEELALNFIEAFRSIPNLPGGPIVEPLLKHLEKQTTLNCIELCRILLLENRLGEDEVISVVDMLTKIIFYDVQYGSIALEIIFDNLSVMNDEMLDEFLESNLKNSLAHFFSISKSIQRKFPDLKSDFQRYGKQQNMKKAGSAFNQQMKKHTMLGYMIKFMEKCIEESESLKYSFQPLLFHTYIRIEGELNKQEQAHLLIPVMKYYFPAEDQLENKIQQYQFQINPPKQEPIKQPSTENLLKSQRMNQSIEVSETPKTEKKLDPSKEKPSAYALKDLEKIKQIMANQKSVEEQKQKDKDMIQKKKELFRSILNQKRIVEFGTKNLQNKEYKCLYEWGACPEENPNKVHGVTQIKLVNLNSEEQTSFAQDVDSLLKKYRKLWRFLFFKYSTFGAKSKPQNQEIRAQQKINMAEVWKMHRQYDAAFLKKEQSQAIIRLINENMKRKTDLQNLTYLGFEEYIFQSCAFGYGKNGYDHLPPGKKLMTFINQLKKITHQKGGNIDLFDNPEQVYFQQTDVIKQFNRRLKNNPEYILPQGYKKVALTQIFYDYEVHPVNFLRFPSTHITVLEVLDQILSESKLGIHIIQPLTHKQEKMIAKPVLFQSLNEKMRNYKNGYLLPKKSPQTSEKKQRSKHIVSFKNQYHPMPKFSIGIKMGLAAVSIKNRFIADQVAYWMDDMLDSVEKNSIKVQNKAKKKIDNEALKRRRVSLRKIQQQQKEEEKKFKKRAESVKQKAETDREKKKSEEKQKREGRRIARKAQKQKQIAAMKKKLQQFEANKRKIQQKKDLEQQRKKQDFEKRKKQKEEYKKGVEEYFQKKKAELEEKQANMKKVKQEQVIKQKQQEEKKQQFYKKLHMNILKKQEHLLDEIEQIKKGFDEVWTSEQIQQVFDAFELPLKYLFDLLVKYQKSKISATNEDQISLNTLHFFTLKFKIVPFMIQKTALAKIYKAVVRKNVSSSGIDFRDFQQTLFRISVKGKDMLNGVIQRKKEKEKMMAQFLSKKSSEGNHYDIEEEIQQSSPSRVLESPKKVSLTEDYLFNTEGVSGETVRQMLKFLNLPKDRQGVEERYREAIESKNLKPKNLLVKELKETLT